jgi:hypothetical protein
MMEHLWLEVVSKPALQALQDNPGYELIITGHSW